MNFTFISEWLHSAQVILAGLAMLMLATLPIPSLSASENQDSDLRDENTVLPDGTYLYGQSQQPDQIGQEYIVFELQDGKLIGALYMPRSEFSCFQGTMTASNLEMVVDHPYEDTQYPYAIALDTTAPIASRNEQTSAAVTLKGYHPLEEISKNDQRMLATCQQEFQ